MRPERRRLSWTLLFALALAGCTGEPSESAMQDTVEAATARRVPGFKRFDSFRKQGCVETRGQPGWFDCYYNTSFVPALGQPKITVNAKGRFKKTDTGYLFQDLGAMPDTRVLK